MPGFAKVAHSKLAKPAKVAGAAHSRAKSSGGGNCGTGHGGFKPGNKCGARDGAERKPAPAPKNDASRFKGGTASSHPKATPATAASRPAAKPAARPAPEPIAKKTPERSARSVQAERLRAHRARGAHRTDKSTRDRHVAQARKATDADLEKFKGQIHKSSSETAGKVNLGLRARNRRKLAIIEAEQRRRGLATRAETKPGAKADKTPDPAPGGKRTASEYWNARRARDARTKAIRDEHKAGTRTEAGPVKVQVGGTRVGPGSVAKVQEPTHSPAIKAHDTPKADDAAKLAPHTHDNHRPGYVGHLNTSLIHADPHRFQYKHGADASGSVGSLAGVKKYDENLGGVIQVWKDPADSKTYVVNGHNRLDLAKKLGADKVTVRYLDAKDHVEARSIGALTNIAEGRGTAVDAAKYFRSRNLTDQDIRDAGIPIREKVATDGMALAKLDEGVFNKVAIGHLTPERGAIIGNSNLSSAQQRAVVKLIEKHEGKKTRITNGQLPDLIDDVRDTPVVKAKEGEKDGGLFGWSKEDESLALHKSKLTDHVKQRLSSEKRLFGIVAKSKAAEDLKRGGNEINTEESGKISQEAAQTLNIFDRLKKLKGPVSRHLNEGAARIHAGENATKVHHETYRRIVQDLPNMIESGHAFGD